MPGLPHCTLAALLLAAQPLTAADYPTFDTALSWQNDMQAAADEARSTGRLLFVMHLSGNLAKSAFT